MQSANIQPQWRLGREAWASFVQAHPELAYRQGKWQFHNFLRHFKRQLLESDAIRLAKGRHWIASTERFDAIAFACATGASSDWDTVACKKADLTGREIVCEVGV